LSVTYDELRRRVRGMAGALYAAGVRRGDRVALALPNGLDAIVAFLAAAAAGTAAPLNPGYKFEEFCFYLADTRAKMLMVPPRRNARRCPARGGAGRHSRGHAGDFRRRPRARTRPGRYRAGFAHQRQHRTAEACAAAPSQSGGVHAHIAETYALGPNDVSLCLMPLFHVHGLMASTMATLLTGGTVVVPAKFNALTFWRMVRDYGVTWYSAVPTMHQLILTRKRSGDEKLRFVRSCSAALAPDLMRRMEEYFAAPVLEAYGMTEASHQMASNPLPPAPQSRIGGTGNRRAHQHSRRAGRELPRGKAGEVCIDGPGVIRDTRTIRKPPPSRFLANGSARATREFWTTTAICI
jgi:oxalate---CoA ligase